MTQDVEKGAEDAYEVRGEIICAKIRLQDVQLKNSIKENKEKVTIVSPSEREGSGQAIRPVKAKLTKLGNIAQWLEFWDAFKIFILPSKAQE